MKDGQAETREQPCPDCQVNEKEEKAERAKKRKNEGRRLNRWKRRTRRRRRRLVNMHGREVEIRDDASSVKKEREKKFKSDWKCKLSRPSVSPHRTQTCKLCVVTLSCYSFGRGSAGRPLMRCQHHHQKYRWTPRRCTSRYGRYPWLHRCRRHCTWIRISRRIWKYFKNSEFENIESLTKCYEHDDWRRFRNCLTESSILHNLLMIDPVWVHSLSALSMTHQSRDCCICLISSYRV